MDSGQHKGIQFSIRSIQLRLFYENFQIHVPYRNFISTKFFTTLTVIITKTFFIGLHVKFIRYPAKSVRSSRFTTAYIADGCCLSTPGLQSLCVPGSTWKKRLYLLKISEASVISRAWKEKGFDRLIFDTLF